MSFPQIPLFDLRLEEEDVEAVLDVLRSGWLTMGPRTAEFERGVRRAPRRPARRRRLLVHGGAAPRLPGRGRRARRRGDRARDDVRRHRRGGRLLRRARRCSPTSSARTTSRWTPRTSRARITPRTKAVSRRALRRLPGRRPGAARALRRARARADRGRRPRARAPTVDGRALGTFGLAGAFSFFSNKVLACGEGGLLATDDDDVAALARGLRSQGMTSGTWSRHTGETDTYDAVGLGFNYRLDEPRAALLLSRLARLGRGVAAAPRAHPRLPRARCADVDGVIVPYDDAGRRALHVLRACRSCSRTRRAATPCAARCATRGVQTSLFYPAVHEFTAYRERFGTPSLPRTEHVARAEITLPLYPDMDEAVHGPRRRRARGGAAMSWDDPAHRRRLRRGGPRGGRRVPALGLADDGPAHEGVRGGGRGWTRRRRTPSPCRAAPRRCTSPARRSASAAGDEVIVPALHVPGDGATRRATSARRPCWRRRLAAGAPDRPRGRRAPHHAAHEGRDRRAHAAATRPTIGGAARAVRRARPRAHRGRRAGASARRTRAAPGDVALPLVLLQEAAAPSARAGWCSPTTRPSRSASGCCARTR